MNLELQRFGGFKALAHPLRIRILELLADGDKNVNELQVLIGSEGSAVSSWQFYGVKTYMALRMVIKLIIPYVIR